MVNLADVDYPFEYDRGIILKGFHTLLVVTSKWVAGSQSAFQWHFAHSNGKIHLSEYTDAEKYHVWKNEEPRPEIETVQNATRTFLGWNDTFEFHPDAVNPSAIKVTTLKRVGPTLELKSIAMGAGVSKAPMTATVTSTFEVQRDSLRFPREHKFPDTISWAEKASTLIYVPEEERGWLVPQLWVLVHMAQVYAQSYSLEPIPPKVGINLSETKEIVLNHSEMQLSPKGMNCERVEMDCKSLKDLVCDLARVLEWAEEHARRQRNLRFSGRDNIYGFEFKELATIQGNYIIRKSSVGKFHGGWITLLDKAAVSGVIFCKGLGEIINCGSERCSHCESPPRDRSYLTAVVNCLQNLKDYGKIPGGGDWKFRAKAFNGCSGCSSCSHRLQDMEQDMKGTPSSSVSSNRYLNGVVVFGKSHQKYMRSEATGDGSNLQLNCQEALI